jgi:serine/threonine protein kinase
MTETLWDLDDERAQLMVEIHLSDLGSVSVRFISTPSSRVYTIDAGPSSFPRYMVAKAPWVRPEGDEALKQSRLEYFCREAEHTVSIAGYPYLHRFGKLRYILGLPFFISAKRDGTLEDVLAAESLSLTDALVIAIQISRGLCYCQDMGLVAHQDLKPANIFIDRLDLKFGNDVSFRFLSRVADFELSNAYIDLGRASGSRPYMSPEQHRAQHQSDGSIVDFSRSDTFAFGVLLHELVTGGLHPVGERTSDIWPVQLAGMSKKWKGSRPWINWIEHGAPIRSPKGAVPTVVQEIVREALAVNPVARPSIHEVQEHLWGALASTDIGTAQSLEVATRRWEEGLLNDPEANWPHGQEILRSIRRTFSQR